jgi:drug/metabolite transporter (DMT)-like permease
MGWGLLWALIAAACTGGATILQAIGAQHARHYRAVDPRLLLSVARSVAYLAGLVLLIASFVLTLLALRTTALFVVQGLASASIAGVAALSAVIFRTRLHWAEWAAVIAVCVGITLLVVSQRPSHTTLYPTDGRWAVLIAAIAISVVALTAHRWVEGAVIPGLLSGLAFGDAAVASRLISDEDGSLSRLMADPASYAIVVSGLIGALLYATALQRGSVPAIFGLSTVGQTIGPAITGWLVLGDSVNPGALPWAALGFALSVAGALSLGRHAAPEQVAPPRPAPEQSPPPEPPQARDDLAGRVS